ncbi:MAG: hypothetical protein EBQ92_07865 [Proteobacteria bacterium]|nr:hypothetical protein [Pseudomonadota bacterium]
MFIQEIEKYIDNTTIDSGVVHYKLAVMMSEFENPNIIKDREYANYALKYISEFFEKQRKFLEKNTYSS